MRAINNWINALIRAPEVCVYVFNSYDTMSSQYNILCPSDWCDCNSIESIHKLKI